MNHKPPEISPQTKDHSDQESFPLLFFLYWGSFISLGVPFLLSLKKKTPEIKK